MTKKEKAKIQAKIEQYRKWVELEKEEARRATDENEMREHLLQKYSNYGAVCALENLLLELS